MELIYDRKCIESSLGLDWGRHSDVIARPVQPATIGLVAHKCEDFLACA